MIGKTRCCATSTPMHASVMGMCVNRSALGQAVSSWLSPLGEPDPLPLAYMPTFSRAATRGTPGLASLWVIPVALGTRSC